MATHTKSQPVKSVTPDDVLKLKAPTSGFLCPISANTYQIDFQEFCIREVDTNNELFRVEKDAQAPPVYDLALDDSSRLIQYTFNAKFLTYKTVGTRITFSVGPQEVKGFRMIERHYFKNKLLKAFDFKFGFCIPNSTNEWEIIYEFPKLSKSEIAEMIANPFLTKSDTFYFVGDQLVIHNKAEYAYSAE